MSGRSGAVSRRISFRSRIGTWRALLAVAFGVFLGSGCAEIGRASSERVGPPMPAPSEVPEVRPGFLAGYLPMAAMPDSLALLPPPPEPGSAAAALDEAVSAAGLAMRGSPRWTLATLDNTLNFPQAAGTFACAIGTAIGEEDTPRLYVLLRRSLMDAGLATYPAKNAYGRKRPFAVNGAPVCVSDEERGVLADDGSYPSGHAAIGWAWALILAEVAPDRAAAILARGRAFGDSRVVCNVHWHSDVSEGRTVGAAAVAVLRSDPGFLADLDMAKGELAAARARGLPPGRDCRAEATALAGG